MSIAIMSIAVKPKSQVSKAQKTQCMRVRDEWGNYHSRLITGDDVVVEYTYFTGRAPRETWSTTVITLDGKVYELVKDGETLESFCYEYDLNEKMKQEILKEVATETRRGRIHRFDMNEDNLAKADPSLKAFVEMLRQTYYCNTYPYLC